MIISLVFDKESTKTFTIILSHLVLMEKFSQNFSSQSRKNCHNQLKDDTIISRSRPQLEQIVIDQILFFLAFFDPKFSLFNQKPLESVCCKSCKV
jgi:hypothetical protein